MHRVLTALTLVCASLALVACRPAPIPAEVDQRLVGEVMMHAELPENLRALCMPGGRLSGSENGAKAEQFIADACLKYGLANVHFEPFAMTTWQDRETVVTLLGDEPITLEGAISLGNCRSTPAGGITAEVIAVGDGSEAAFEEVGDAIKDKFVLVTEGGRHRGSKMRDVVAAGGAGLIQISRLSDQSRVGSCHHEARPEPGVVVTGDEGALLQERLEAGAGLRLNVKIDADIWEANPRNVIAEIPGSGPLAEELVIVCAHLDSWHLAEGAIDNGNGSACILEVARALAQADWQPQRTVRFIWFMGEEHGLHGSRAYVADHLDEMDNIVAVLNVDMPGDPSRFGTFKHPEIIPFLQEIARDLVGFQIQEDVAEASWTASDHAAFMRQGVCAIGLWGSLGDGVKFYHSKGDTYEVVDLQATIEAAAAMSVVVRRLADVPERPSVRFEPEPAEGQ
ncbi:MAG: M20/M25/M40 family metallo-hydrolase [Phycisphaerales bacterium JB038]